MLTGIQLICSTASDAGAAYLLKTLNHYYTKSEAAKLLKVTPRTIEKLVQKGVLPVMRIGRIVRFPERGFNEALAKYTVGGRSGR